MSLLKPLVAQGRTIRAIVFDMDGLMFNTEDLYDLVGQQMLARRGHQFDLELKLRMMGRTASVAFEIMRQTCNLNESIEELKRENDQLFMELLETRLEKLPGLDSLMMWIAERNLPLGLATSSRRFLAEYKLQRFGLRPKFRAIVTGDEVQHGKPDPEIYLAVAKQLNVAPTEMMAFEDSVVGSTAAAAAGAFTIAIPGKHGEQLDYSHVDLITDRLDSPAIEQFFASHGGTS